MNVKSRTKITVADTYGRDIQCSRWIAFPSNAARSLWRVDEYGYRTRITIAVDLTPTGAAAYIADLDAGAKVGR